MLFLLLATQPDQTSEDCTLLLCAKWCVRSLLAVQVEQLTAELPGLRKRRLSSASMARIPRIALIALITSHPRPAVISSPPCSLAVP